jgi:hydroxymethylpyrimidine/phosphomethylpyrimidine kinase
MQIALTIAGSDPSGGAGLQADLKTFQAHGVFGMSVVTAVTVQNSQKVYDVHDVPSSIVRDQIIRLFEDIKIHVVKIGMVSNTDVIHAIADALNSVERPPIVLDPVMISKSGYALLKPDTQHTLVEHLFPFAEVVTPNLPEAEVLLGQKIETIDQMETAAAAIQKLGANKVVIKGGHLKDAPATDILFDGSQFKPLESVRIQTKNTHGTGCTFASAIAANLALGHDFFEAVTNAKNYVTTAIAHSLNIGKGHGPTNHFYELYQKAGIKQD